MSTAPTMDIARLMRIHLPSLPSRMSLSAMSFCSPVVRVMSSPPRMSSSRETPNVWDMAMTTSMSGRLRPFSQLETACRVTPRRDANCSCVRPAPVRTALTLSPNSIGFPPLLGPASPGQRLHARKHSLHGQQRHDSRTVVPSTSTFVPRTAPEDGDSMCTRGIA